MAATIPWICHWCTFVTIIAVAMVAAADECSGVDEGGFPLYDPLPTTGVTFQTTDAPLQGLYAHGAAQEAGNNQRFLKKPSFLVLEEGEVYRAAWIETQPMAGAMYAVRDVRLALNNQLVFLRTQREDGRFPVRSVQCVHRPAHTRARGRHAL